MRIWFPTTLTAVCVTLNAFSQTPAAPAPASSGAPMPPVGAGQPGNATVPVPPGVQNPNQLTPAISQPRTGVTQGTTQATGVTQGTQAGAAVQNQAFTASDQTVLNGIQQAVQRQFPAGAPSGVGYHVVNGVVTLVGNVQTAAQEKQLESMVRQMPGVTGVVDQLTIGQFSETQRTGTGQLTRQG